MLKWYYLVNFIEPAVNLRISLRSHFFNVIDFLNDFVDILKQSFSVGSFSDIFFKTADKNLFNILILSKKNSSIHQIV